MLVRLVLVEFFLVHKSSFSVPVDLLLLISLVAIIIKLVDIIHNVGLLGAVVSSIIVVVLISATGLLVLVVFLIIPIIVIVVLVVKMVIIVVMISGRILLVMSSVSTWPTEIISSLEEFFILVSLLESMFNKNNNDY